MRQTSLKKKKYTYYNGVYYLGYELTKVLGTKLRTNHEQKRLSDFDDRTTKK